MQTSLEPRQIAKSIIEDIYANKDITNVLGLITEETVLFNSYTSLPCQGVLEVKKGLFEEVSQIEKTDLINYCIREQETSEEIFILIGIILSTQKEKATIFCQVLLRFSMPQDGKIFLKGMHFIRDLEPTILCDSMVKDILDQENMHEHIQETTILKDKDKTSLKEPLACAFISYEDREKRTLIRYTEALYKMLEYEREEDFIKDAKNHLTAFYHQTGDKQLKDNIQKQLNTESVYQIEYRLSTKTGKIIYVIECGRKLHNVHQNKYQAVILDITPIKQASAMLTYKTTYDELTGIYNEETFCKKVKDNFILHPEKNFEVMQLDLERFKVVNDVFGSETGDRILQNIASFFIKLNLPYTVYARLHADHFLLSYPTDHQNRKFLIHSLTRLATTLLPDYNLRFRFGIYTVDDKKIAPSVMCDWAGMALTKAKMHPLLECAEYDENMRRFIVNEQDMVNQMGESLAKGDFILYVQPKYSLATEEIAGGEVLVRWIHPTKGYIPPSDFIPSFEKNGFITKLDRYIWEETCKWLRSWLDAGNEPIALSVNVSRVDLYDANLPKVILRLVEKYKLPPQYLELEITESAYIDNPQRIIDTTLELQKYGFKILMDDFGSGYSSLNMLKDLPVDILKIDLKFLDNSDIQGRAGNILNSVVHMAKWLAIPVIVEGVETRKQADFLKTIGCTWVQGYFFSRPIPIADYNVLLKKYYKKANTHEGHIEKIPLSEKNSNFDNRINQFLEKSAGAMALYELQGESLELLRANDAYFDIVHENPQNFAYQSQNILANVYLEDRQAFLDAIEAAKRSREITQCQVRQHLKDGTTIWLNVHIRILSFDLNQTILYLALDDITHINTIHTGLKAMFSGLNIGYGFFEIEANNIYAHYLNPYLAQKIGIKYRDSSKDTTINITSIFTEDTLTEIILGTERANEQKKSFQLTYSLITQKGTTWQTDTSGIVIASTSGNYFLYQVFRDASKVPNVTSDFPLFSF